MGECQRGHVGMGNCSTSLLLFWIVLIPFYIWVSSFFLFFFACAFSILSATNALSCVCVYGRGLFEGGQSHLDFCIVKMHAQRGGFFFLCRKSKLSSHAIYEYFVE